jgi:hypothetical protein
MQDKQSLMNKESSSKLVKDNADNNNLLSKEDLDKRKAKLKKKYKPKINLECNKELYLIK